MMHCRPVFGRTDGELIDVRIELTTGVLAQRGRKPERDRVTSRAATGVFVFLVLFGLLRRALLRVTLLLESGQCFHTDLHKLNLLRSMTSSRDWESSRSGCRSSGQGFGERANLVGR
jgi:hypothetical protein